MSKTIFLAGAGGAIGRRLVPILHRHGYAIVGTTRSRDRASILSDAGVSPVIVDVFDESAVIKAVCESQAYAIIHQLTDLSAGLEGNAGPVLRANARLRREGTRNLVNAALSAGVSRFVAQSIAWAYAAGQTPHDEEAPLDLTASGTRGISVRDGVAPLEQAVLETAGIEGKVLRYGELYGPGTWTATAKGTAPVHVDAAALAACLAVEHGTPGPYNIADAHGSVCIDKAVAELNWWPEFRLSDPAGAEPR